MTDRLSVSAVEDPRALALVGAHTWTFDELAVEGARVVSSLEGSTARRAIVIARADDVTVATLLGLLDRRIGFALAHPRWTPAELHDAIAQVEPAWILDGGRVTVTSHQAVAEEQAILFSSGTTGAPKAARLSRGALLAAAAAHAGALPFEPGDRWLLSLSPARVGGLSILTRSLFARAAVVVGPTEPFDPLRFAAGLRERRVTLLSLVPSMLAKLLEARADPGPVRAALLGGAACPPSLLARGRAARWPLLPTYGMTETCAQVCTQRLEAPSPRGVGRPLPGVDVRTRDDGVIEVRGPTLMDGYLGLPELGGWLATGDLGRWLPDGSLEIVGRADDRIVSGGETIDPAEVEAVLVAHPRIHDACVVGDPSEVWGEVVTALVVSDGVSLDELRAHLDAHLARYKHPRRLVERVALPRRAGKLDRRTARNGVGGGSPIGSTGVSGS